MSDAPATGLVIGYQGEQHDMRVALIAKDGTRVGTICVHSINSAKLVLNVDRSIKIEREYFRDGEWIPYTVLKAKPEARPDSGQAG